MKLDAVGRHAFLSFEIIKEADSGYLHRHIGGLKIGGRGKHRVKLRARVGNAGREGTAWADATRRRYFGNHCAPSAIREYHVVIRIVGEHIFRQGGIQNEKRGFRGLCAEIVRDGIRRRTA